MSEERTFRGRTLAEVVPRIKDELGEGAIAVRVRHGRTGGIAGFFAQRCVEVDARPGPEPGAGGEQPAVPADPGAFERLLGEATAAPSEPFVPADVPGTWEQLVEDARRQAGADPSVADVLGEPRAREGAAALAALFRPDAAPAPAVPPEPGAAPGAPSDAAWPAPAAPGAPSDTAWPEPAGPAATPAAPPRAAVPAALAPPPRAAAPLAPVEPHWPEAALAVHRSLTARGMDPELVAELVGEAVDHLLPFSSAGSLRPLVAGQLARRLPAMPRRRAGRLVLGFVGAGGSGKTACVSRLALAYAERAGRPVACLTLRAPDGGAGLLREVSEAGIPVHAAGDAAQARRFLDRVGDRALVVVDTPGVSPRAEAELRQLAAELRQLALDECHLALPATLSPQAAGELVQGTRPLGVDALALTHVDETEHLGAAIGAAIDARLPISYVARGPAGRGRAGLRPALVEALTLELVG